ncbi:MAG TPA: TolC family protein [Gemmataceae bacterium]|jgi:cobalt-zinc-cadmium efflux system outer membrane protein
MLRVRFLTGVLPIAFLLLIVPAAHAQGQLAGLADDLIILTQRLQKKETERTHQHLGPGPGSTDSPFTVIPGAPRPVPGEPPSASTPGRANILPPPTRVPAATPAPLYGVLDLPLTADEGPPGGVTLDQAIERLVQENPDLRTRFQELSKAQADILTAGLRNNPFLFGNVGSIPYQNFSPQRPGGVNYEITVIQSWDVNHKRKSRILVAQSAKNVLECLYQDSVRTQIDNLYTAFLDVLATRETVRQQQVGMEGLEEVVKATRPLVESKQKPQTELDRVLVQRASAFLAMQESTSALRQAKQALGVLLNLPPAEVDCLEVRGAIGGFDLELPEPDKLIEIALQVRPDLNAYRLGVQRANAEVQMARADRWADVFVLYTPWQLQDNGPIGAQNATSWSLGALVTLPVFNRNQGNIARAQTTVTQTIIELQAREQQVIAEVRRAYQEYATTRAAVKYFQDNILPVARRIRDDKLRLFKAGTEDVLVYLSAQKDYNDVVRQYAETAVRHRRSSLRLNTAVGQRLVP